MTYMIGVIAFVVFRVIFRFILNPLTFVVVPRAAPLIVAVRMFLGALATVLVMEHFDKSANPLFVIVALFIINFIINARVYSIDPRFHNAIEQVGLIIGAIAFLVFYFYNY